MPEWVKTKRLTIIYVGKDMEQLEFSYTVEENVKWNSGKSLVVHHKTKHKHTY